MTALATIDAVALEAFWAPRPLREVNRGKRQNRHVGHPKKVET